MIETHPFGNFVPKNTKYLLLGSFTSKNIEDPSYDWFYCSKRNQFWAIIEQVYGISFANTSQKKALFEKLGIAIADIILQCERKHGNSLDSNLINIVYNTAAVTQILQEHKIKSVFFSSRFVEKLYKKVFKDIQIPNIEMITLPSPSPRYAAMSRSQKILKYKELFPAL